VAVDLSDVLACGTDGLGHPVLAGYYRSLFERALPAPDYAGAFRVRAALNFGVQQLATRSRVAPETERYLQIGGFSADDLPAALIEAMPHTIVACLQPVEGCERALASLRAKLPGDALPDSVMLTSFALPGVSFGLIALFADGSAPDIGRWLGLLNPRGRLLLVHRGDAQARPTLSLHA
jgi:hypothetical protein